MSEVVKYRDFNITKWVKPIPIRAWDYDFVHVDYDGAEDGEDHRCGSGASIKDCKQQIDDMIEWSYYPHNRPPPSD